MTLNIFDDIFDWLKEVSDQFYRFVMDNYNEPFLWITIFGILLLIAVYGISNLANK